MPFGPRVHESRTMNQGVGESTNPETNRACDDHADRQAKSFPTPGAAPAVDLHHRKRHEACRVSDRGTVPDSISGTLHSLDDVQWKGVGNSIDHDKPVRLQSSFTPN